MSLHVVQPDAPKPMLTSLVFGVNASGSEFTMDYETLLQTRLLIQASSGGGKTYFLRQLLAALNGRLQRIVLDIENEFKDVMDRISVDDAIENGVWSEYCVDVLNSGRDVVLDFSGMSKSTAAVYVGDFCEKLMSLPPKMWGPKLVVIDEAHLFAPDKVLKLESAKPVIDLACRGRKRGICAVFATQRLSKLHKDVAAECLNKLIGRTQLDIDVKRAAIDMEMSARRAQAVLPALTPGLFFAMGPAVNHESKGQIVAIKGPDAAPEIPRIETFKEVDTVSEGAVGSTPNWLINFECMEQAAEKLRRQGPGDGKLNMPEVLEEAGIDNVEWYDALGRMKVQNLSRCLAFYQVVGRKMRGQDSGEKIEREIMRTGATAAPKPALTRIWDPKAMNWRMGMAPPKVEEIPPPDEEPEEVEEETLEDEVELPTTMALAPQSAVDNQNVGAVTNHVTSWLEDLDDEKRRRVIKAVCVLLEINLDDAPPPPPKVRKKPGPKPGFRKGLRRPKGRITKNR